jgi:VWFA-related protein
MSNSWNAAAYNKPVQNVSSAHCNHHVLQMAMTLMVAFTLHGECVAQSSSSARTQASPSITTTTNLVIVPALVRAPSMDSLPTLKASDFLLTDNGVAQAVTLEDVEHQPLAVLVLLQTGGAADEQLRSYAKLGTMLTYLTEKHPHRVALLSFDSQPEYAWDFTLRVSDIEDGFLHPRRGDGRAAILDAVDYGIDLLSKQPPTYRRIILLISQTHDDNSSVQAEDIIRRLGENNITIECLAFSPEKAWLKDQFTKPRHENAPYQYAPNLPPLLHTFNLGEPLGIALKAMREDTSATVAQLSGGESLLFSSKAGLEEQLAVLANHFANTYSLSFRPTSKTPGFHSLQLRIAGHPDFQISARASYWATGDGGAAK